DGGTKNPALPRRTVPTREPGGAQAHAPPSRAGEDARAHPPLAGRLSRSRHPLEFHRGISRRDGDGFRTAARVAGRGRTRFDRVGCFRYEAVEAAAANALAPPVADEIKQERWDRLMQHQQAISAKRLKRKVGTRQPILIDEIGPTVAKGRSRADAPEIDGNVF